MAESRNRVIIFAKNLAENISNYIDLILTKLDIHKIIQFLDERYVAIPELVILKETIVTIAPERSISCQCTLLSRIKPF